MTVRKAYALAIIYSLFFDLVQVIIFILELINIPIFIIVFIMAIFKFNTGQKFILKKILFPLHTKINFPLVALVEKLHYRLYELAQFIRGEIIEEKQSDQDVELHLDFETKEYKINKKYDGNEY